jgi:hypothetical protein
VEIKYLPYNPWTNRLVYRHPESSIGDSLAGIFAGLSPWLLFIILINFSEKYVNPTKSSSGKQAKMSLIVEDA